MPLGRAMAAIRDDELAAGCMGIDTTRVKLTAFVLSAVVARRRVAPWRPTSSTPGMPAKEASM
jgi:ABC-type xylose transport system permease subunit